MRIRTTTPKSRAPMIPPSPPIPRDWLDLEEEERLDLAVEYHRRAGLILPREEVHATVHVIMENEIAMDDESPVRRAVERLMGEGLDRHEALHAVGSVFTDKLQKTLSDPEACTFPLQDYNVAIEQLAAASWRSD